MPIAHELEIEVPRPPAECFAFVDDFANAPRWNPLCVSLEHSGGSADSSKGELVYVYKQGGRQGKMSGSVAEREPGKRLLLRFTDTMFAIDIGFRFDAVPGGTRLQHTLELTPRSFMTRLMTPMIRAATKKQIKNEIEALARLLAR